MTGSGAERRRERRPGRSAPRARRAPLLPRGDGHGVRGPLRPRRRAIRRPGRAGRLRSRRPPRAGAEPVHREQRHLAHQPPGRRGEHPGEPVDDGVPGDRVARLRPDRRGLRRLDRLGAASASSSPRTSSPSARGTGGARLDLGGIGKGYAVDRMAEVLEEWEIPRALVHGGYSSVLALEAPPDRDGWPLTLSAPGPGENRVLVAGLGAPEGLQRVGGAEGRPHPGPAHRSRGARPSGGLGGGPAGRTSGSPAARGRRPLDRVHDPARRGDRRAVPEVPRPGGLARSGARRRGARRHRSSSTWATRRPESDGSRHEGAMRR